MSIFSIEPFLADIVHRVTSPQNSSLVVITPQEGDAQKYEALLRQLSQGSLEPTDIVYMPGFFQTGVFRYESARKVIARRVAALFQISQKAPKLIITSLAGYARLAPSFDWAQNNAFLLKKGDEIEQDLVLAVLETYGYSEVQRVEEMGEFSLRGSILDLWTPGQKCPSRVEFFAENIEALRSFRAADQRSFATLDQISLLPCREFLWPVGNELNGALEKFNDTLLSNGVTGTPRFDLLENLRHSVPFPGIDDVAYMIAPSSDFNSLASQLEHLSAFHKTASTPVLLGSVENFKKSFEEIKNLYEKSHQASYGKGFLAPKVEKVFPKLEILRSEFESSFQSTAPTSYEPLQQHPSRFVPSEALCQELLPTEKMKLSSRVLALHRLLGNTSISALVILCYSRDTFLDLAGILSKYFPDLENQAALPEKLPIFSGKILATENLGTLQKVGEKLYCALSETEGGFLLPQSKVLVVSEGWIRGGVHEDSIEVYTDEETRTASRSASEILMSSQFGDFVDGDLVVHVQHGISRFKGLVTVTLMDITGDFLALEYSGGDRIYVPVHKLNLVQKYVGAGGHDDSVLDSLKSASWEKRKTKAKVKAEKLAKELLEHQARRAMTPGHPYSKLGEDYAEFEAAFPFDDTPDQQKAIREIMSDMAKPKAMDRLLCGDVGFGKTEVAMRAAYRAVLDGKQVAWLVPTTVLAHQHFRSLRERFAEFPVKVEVLDRSVGNTSGVKALDRLKSGGVDIVIGTHRLLSKDIQFRDLGLLIVDEEQRFGVLQKEKIKQLAYGIDVLTMTATPIPRTLQLAMLGLRDLSLLSTPPKARLAVKTFVCPFEDSIVRDALQSEMARGGQLFYVHNRVDELPSVLEFLKSLVPEARIAMGHGKMQQKELDDIMIALIENKYDVLLCTTIIESGIDMPNVNTILVQNADYFGLAQLYQLRGRVGRRATRGYAYFLTSLNAQEEDEGMKRLNILKDHQELGSGFLIASHDLEMRGAGNILGDEQKGKVNDVGLETYLHMLDDAIKAMGGIRVRTPVETEIQLPLSAQIPEDYITNSRERLRIYRRFFGANTEEALQNLIVECEDRFGDLPEQTKNLCELSRMRRWLISVGALALTVGDEATEIRFGKEVLQAQDDEHAERLVKRILDISNRQFKGVRLTPDGRVLLGIRKKNFINNAPAAISELKRFLSLLAGEAYAEK
jgi:transcription-repair coupling factor (superfamily II helicase)